MNPPRSPLNTTGTRETAAANWHHTASIPQRGEIPFPQCDAWRLELHTRFDAALAQTQLPERPDYPAANAWLLRARRTMI